MNMTKFFNESIEEFMLDDDCVDYSEKEIIKLYCAIERN